MSRVGKQIIQIPQGVDVTIEQGLVRVKGPKGILERIVHPKVTITKNENSLSVDVVKKEDKAERSLWGTFSAHMANMMVGVTEGFQKQLEVNGVGYKVAMQGTDIRLDVGYSHPVIYKVAAGVTVKVEKNVITVESSDKELLGRVAAEIRSVRKPEPYKGKGIKYMDEHIRRKAGKTAGKE